MMNNNYETLKECRISNSKNLIEVLDLGLQPLANSLKKNNLIMRIGTLCHCHFVRNHHCYS